MEPRYPAFGRYMQRSRERSGLTLDEAAKAIGLSSREKLASWESGEARPTLRALWDKICQTYGLDGVAFREALLGNDVEKNQPFPYFLFTEDIERKLRGMILSEEELELYGWIAYTGKHIDSFANELEPLAMGGELPAAYLAGKNPWNVLATKLSLQNKLMDEGFEKWLQRFMIARASRGEDVTKPISVMELTGKQAWNLASFYSGQHIQEYLKKHVEHLLLIAEFETEGIFEWREDDYQPKLTSYAERIIDKSAYEAILDTVVSYRADPERILWDKKPIREIFSQSNASIYTFAGKVIWGTSQNEKSDIIQRLRDGRDHPNTVVDFIVNEIIPDDLFDFGFITHSTNNLVIDTERFEAAKATYAETRQGFDPDERDYYKSVYRLSLTQKGIDFIDWYNHGGEETLKAQATTE